MGQLCCHCVEDADVGEPRVIAHHVAGEQSQRKAEEEAELKKISKRLVESAIHHAVQQYLSEGSSLCAGPGGCGPSNALGKETSQESVNGCPK
uniref:A-kinase anchor protein 7-like n=1 Tax=Myxine glutinosa TaxID=7769 RepID=UPI00358FD978